MTTTPLPDAMTEPGASRNAARIPGSLSVVLPAHNEEENLPFVIDRAIEVLPRFVTSFELVIVNDGSKDRTGEIIDEYARRDDRITPVHHPKNRGYGAALTSGFRAATGDYVMFMDSDRQFDIVDVGLLAPFVPRFDIVAGFRMERSDPFHRRLFAEIFNLVVRTLFGVHMRDVDCAFKVFRGDLLRSMELESPGALINTEMQAKLRRMGATMVQVGVHHYPRVAGAPTGGNPQVILRAMRNTLPLWWRMRSYQPPAVSPSPRGPYRLGDVVVGGAMVVAALIVSKLVKR